jgi:hypothetical protein
MGRFHLGCGKMKKRVNRPLLNAVERILIDKWDPDSDRNGIFGCHIPALRVYAMLESGQSAEDIAIYLEGKERHGGLFVCSSVCRTTADLIIVEWQKNAPN